MITQVNVHNFSGAQSCSRLRGHDMEISTNILCLGAQGAFV